MTTVYTKNERRALKVLEATKYFIFNDYYMEVVKQEQGYVTYNFYNFKRDETPDLRILNRNRMSYDEFYQDLKDETIIPIYKDTMRYDNFVAAQKSYVESIPRYFKYAGKVFHIRDINIEGNNNILYLKRIRHIQAEDVLELHQVRFVDPYDQNIAKEDGDKNIRDIEGIYDKTEVLVYMLREIYSNTKPMSMWKFDPTSVLYSQTNAPSEDKNV